MTAEAADHLARAGELLNLLERETLALQAGDVAALKALCFDKIGHLRQMEALLVALKAPARAGLQEQQRRSLAELLQRCRKRSQLNEALLNARLKRARNAVLVRRGPPSNYDARGGGGYEPNHQLRSVA